MSNEIRLNKYLSEAGICSRREADRLIEAGKVTVDETIADLGTRGKSMEEAVTGRDTDILQTPVLRLCGTLLYCPS